VADGLKASEASMSVGGPESDTTGFLKGLGEVGFGTKRMDGGVELAKLIFALAESRDVGCQPPVTQIVGRFS